MQVRANETSTAAMRIDWENETRTTGDTKNATNLIVEDFPPQVLGNLMNGCHAAIAICLSLLANLTGQLNRTGRGRS